MYVRNMVILIICNSGDTFGREGALFISNSNYITWIKMQGLGLQSIKKNPALIPLYVCVGAGACGAIFYLFRLATRNPDVTWNRKTNPEPWQEYKDKQYKFYSPIRDYSKIKSPAPNYDE